MILLVIMRTRTCRQAARWCLDAGAPALWQMCILDGNAYDAKCLEAGAERDDDLDTCSLLLNNKSTPLLQPGASAAHSNDHKVVVQLTVRTSFEISSWSSTGPKL